MGFCFSFKHGIKALKQEDFVLVVQIIMNKFSAVFMKLSHSLKNSNPWLKLPNSYKLKGIAEEQEEKI